MTDDERNEFEKSIGTARRVYREHQHGDPTPLGIVVGALIRAVELLAGHGQFPGAAKSETTMPTTKAEAVATTSGLHELARVINERVRALRVHVPTSPQERPATFPDELVERLAKSGSPDWEYLPDYMQERRRRHACAILSELASTPCELPTSEPIAHILETCGLRSAHANDYGKAVAAMLCKRVAPVFAAKDASLTHYRKSFEAKQARVTELEAVANQSAQKYAQALARITELESRTPANDVQNAERAQYEKTIELQNRQIAELKGHAATITTQANQYKADRDHVEETCRMHSAKVIELEKWKHDNKRFTDEWYEAVDALCELWPKNEPIEDNPPQGDWIRRLIGLKEKRIADLETDVTREKNFGDVHHKKCEDQMAEIVQLEKRIAELTAPVLVDGKTLGQVLLSEYERTVANGYDEYERAELAARAVLRTFSNGAETLRKIRREAGELDFDGESGMKMLAMIDAEIANIEGVKE